MKDVPPDRPSCPSWAPRPLSCGLPCPRSARRFGWKGLAPQAFRRNWETGIAVRHAIGRTAWKKAHDLRVGDVAEILIRSRSVAVASRLNCRVIRGVDRPSDPPEARDEATHATLAAPTAMNTGTSEFFCAVSALSPPTVPSSDLECAG